MTSNLQQQSKNYSIGEKSLKHSQGVLTKPEKINLSWGWRETPCEGHLPVLTCHPVGKAVRQKKTRKDEFSILEFTQTGKLVQVLQADHLRLLKGASSASLKRNRLHVNSAPGKRRWWKILCCVLNMKSQRCSKQLRALQRSEQR